jgi:hypothetical protein
MRKLLKSFAILVAVLFLSLFSSASAISADLTWEKGTTQEIEIDNSLSENLLNLIMQSGGNSLVFSQVSTGAERSIYQAEIPDAFENKNFAIIAKFKDGTSLQISTVKVVNQSNYYNPVNDFAGITATSITLFALLALWGTNDSQAGKRNEEDEYADQKADLTGVDTNSVGKDFIAAPKLRRSFMASYGLDEFRNLSTISLSKFSPMLSRLMSDGGYLQYFLGSLALVFPISGVVLGYLAHKDIVGYGYVTTPALSISIALIVLGCIDAGAAFIAAIVFGFLCYTSSLMLTPFDLRTYLGLSLLWFTPALMANATRSLRKSRRDSGIWDRTADVVIGSLLTGWAVKGVIGGLNGLAHLTLPLSEYADLCGAVAGGVILIRYLLEEIASYQHEGYLAYVSPKTLHEQSSFFRLISWFLRGFLFLFLSVSFFGLSWQLWVALGLFVAPLLIGVIKSNFPNFPILYQLIPVGIPSIILMSLLGKFYSGWVDALEISAEDKARTIFLIMSIPGFIFMILKAFGRKPRKGDVRWYMRPQFNYFYKLTGPIFLIIAMGMTLGVVG